MAAVVCLLGACGAEAAGRGPQQLVVSLHVNTLPKGEYFAYLGQSGELFLQRGDLRQFVTLPDGAQTRRFDGEEYVALQSLAGVGIAFDEDALSLALTFPPEAFAASTYSLATAPPAAATANDGSALFNYRLGYSGGTAAAAEVWTLGAEQAVRSGRWLLRNQSFHQRAAASTDSVRLATQLVHDQRDELRRWIAGDAPTLPGALGGSVQLGGIAVAKAYQLQPYFIRQPRLNFAGSVTLPSQVEFYVGETRVLREQIAPGPFEITDFGYYGGQRDVRVVVRDALGREQVFSYPYYFADRGLAAGLHDYSYHFGLLREDFGFASDRYGNAAFSGFHQYGFTDWLTAGLQGEGTADFGNVGPSAVLRHDRLGVVAASGAVSHHRTDGAGAAAALDYSYQAGDFSAALAGRNFGRRYAMLRSDLAIDPPRRDVSGVVAYASRRWGSFSVGRSYVETRGAQRLHTTTLGYSRVLPGRVHLFASYRRNRGDAPLLGVTTDSGGELFVGLQYLPGRDTTLSAFATRQEPDVYSTQLQAANTLRAGEGLAWRMAVERQREPDGTRDVVAPELEYHSRYAKFLGFLQSSTGTAPGGSTYMLAAAGSVAAVGGKVALSRPIEDSFALAEISPPVAGVRVYHNQQEAGRTGASGRLLLPTVTSFMDNRITIDDKDIPIEYAVAATSQRFSPEFRTGALVRFTVQRMQMVSGRLQRRWRGRLQPIEFATVAVTVDGAAQEFQTGRGGEFYLENLPAGAHAAQVHAGGRDCRFTLRIPDTSETFVSLDDVVACDD